MTDVGFGSAVAGFIGAESPEPTDKIQWRSDVRTVIFLAQSITEALSKEASVQGIDKKGKESIFSAASNIIKLLARYSNSVDSKLKGQNKYGGSGSSSSSSNSDDEKDEIMIESKLANLNENDIDSMMNEIDESNRINDQSLIDNSKAKHIIVKPFLGSKYEKDYTLQARFWKDFCSPLKGKSGKVSDERILEDFALQTKWRDYCTLRFRHFVLELLPILRANCNSKNVNAPCNLSNKFLYKRHQVGNLPNITDVAGLVDYDFKNYTEIEKFINNLSMIEKKYFVAWNGIAALFLSFSKDDPNFDGHWHKKIKQQSYSNYTNTGGGNSNNNDHHRGSSVFETSFASPNSILKHTISKRFSSARSSRSGSIFSNAATPKGDSIMVSPPSTNMLTQNDLRIELKKFMLARLQKTGLFETRSDVITAIFDENNSVQCFDELIDYCIQDISDPSVYCRYKNDGFEYFIINRLTFAVFIGLFNNELSKHLNIMNQFEDLRTFFTFVWDFSVYNMCFARGSLSDTNVGITFDESFYISQFLFWKEHCCYGLRREEAKMLEIKQRSLSHSQSGLREMSFSQGPNDMTRELSGNSIDSGHGRSKKKKKKHKKSTMGNGRYEDGYDDANDEKERISLIINCNYFQEGTLLHSAAYADMLHYCRLLCENGSDIHKHSQSNGQTPYIISKLAIRRYFDSLMIPKFTTTKAQESEVNYFALKNQKAFSNYFMLYLGINVRDKEGLVPHKPMPPRANEKTIKFYQDDLYFNLDRFDGTKAKETFDSMNGESQKQALDTMQVLTRTILKLLKDKLPISDDLLTLCFEYCLQFDRNLLNEFITVLEQTSKECLYSDGDMRPRNIAWFKQFLLKSKVWMLSSYDEKYDGPNSNNGKDSNKNNDSGVTSPNSQAGTRPGTRPGTTTGGKRRARYSFSDENENFEIENEIEMKKNENEMNLRDRIDKELEKKQKSGLLYNFIDNCVENSTKEMQKYIWQNVNKEMENGRESWNDLITMKNFQSYDLKEIRQDYIENGIQCDKTEQQLWVMQPSVDATTNYDCFKEYNTKSYLTKLLSLAHSLNPQFHKDMKRVFKDICNNPFVYRAAPVKSFSKCVLKAESEYHGKKFPSVAYVTDFIRSSVTFENVNDLINAVHQFKLVIETENGGCVTDIVSIENGFEHVSEWKSEEDCHFIDLKINVIVQDMSNPDGGAMIAEIVFLLNFLLNSKKIGHSLQDIKMRSELIENVFKMEMIDCSYNLYKEKIHGLIVNRNPNYLSKELIWHPNMVLSMIDDERKPLMYHILARDDAQRFKLFDLFYANMVFFHSILLGKDTGAHFMHKYFNYNQCKDVIKETQFWSIETQEMVRESKKYQIIDKIMKSEYFQGLSQLPKPDNEKILFKCVENNCFQYLSLIFEFPIKNEASIVNGLNFEWRPFCKIFLTNHCSDEWLHLLMFNFDKFGISVKINQTDLQTAYNFCIKEKNEKWSNMIEAYADRTNQTIDKQSRPKKWVNREAELQPPRVKSFLKNISPRIFGK